MMKAIKRFSLIMLALALQFGFCISIFSQTAPDRVMPADFKSDGCSLFPDGNYRECCVEHDKAYYFGGTKEERKAADRQLCDCVRAKGHRFLSPIMYLGIRIGGVAWLPTPFRWGFGNKRPKKPNK
jgi:hypothetical protein